jgi:beta-N-acetylhexosaminidase
MILIEPPFMAKGYGAGQKRRILEHDHGRHDRLDFWGAGGLRRIGHPLVWATCVAFASVHASARPLPEAKGGERLVGACLVVGVTGTTLDRATRKALATGRIAGIILLKDNIVSVDQVRALTRSARQAATSMGFPAPLICIDQEGGRVDRLGELPGFPDQPAAADCAKMKLSSLEALSYRVGVYMSRLGFNLDFAPDVDLAKGSGIIGDRSYGIDPSTVAECAGAVIRGLHRAKILAIVKHFPGHGMTHADSHLGLPVVAPSASILQTHESAFVKSMIWDPDGAMLAHLLVRNLDPRFPASLSPVLISQLRSIVGDHRLIFTDSGSMGALRRYGSEAARAAQALSSGVDVYLTTTAYPDLGKNFNDRVSKKLSSISELRRAASRVTDWRRTKLGDE